MSLEDLAEWEERLMDALPPGGHFEERVVQIEGARLPEQWRDVVDGYSDLLDEAASRIEALRRAVFLLWCSWNEPWGLTGIRTFAREVELHVLARLDQELAAEQPDPELCSMLRAYGRGLPFDRYPQLKALSAFFTSGQAAPSIDSPLGSFQGRGALGRYWLSRT